MGAEFLTGTSIDFSSFVKSHHSMRTYLDEPITNEEIIQAIELAKAAPSACNRQPWHVYYSFDDTKDRCDAEFCSTSSIPSEHTVFLFGYC